MFPWRTRYLRATSSHVIQGPTVAIDDKTPQTSFRAKKTRLFAMASFEKTKLSWYADRPTEEQITPDARKLLAVYSRVEPERVTDHVIQLRDEAWEVHPYPCIGQFRFLNLSLKYTEEYQQILERLHRGQTFLDMACCFGQEIRQLVADGAPSENIYGCDLRPEYFELGYKLFRDRDHLHAKFLSADVFDANSPLAKLQNHFDMIYAGSFFHLFDYDNQLKASKTVARLLRPESGSSIFGRQVGALKAAEHNHNSNPEQKMFRHSPESLAKMWEEIGEELGARFTVTAKTRELEGKQIQNLPSDAKWIHFVIRRD
jgi:SAM-dependent methyltransferase